jgi:hypothetical protein
VFRSLKVLTGSRKLKQRVDSLFEFVKSNRLSFKDFIKIGVLLYPISKSFFKKVKKIF